ncbi:MULTISPECIES: DEAD/DEAH box helicase [Sphingobacterium]|uniref:DEAD/DEAH box helicase n=1 Tax=Sphingobacterium TaxID=28453 RepID=UPI0013DBADB2|nr:MULTISPECIES: DEAD/DEAH box helicase [unclassified Sphingobacterium]
MQEKHTVVLQHIILSSCSVYDLMRYLAAGSTGLDLDRYATIYPLHIDLNEGLFTRESVDTTPPTVGVLQEEYTLTLTCTCTSISDKLCIHQLEVIDAVLRQEDYRIFFDSRLRDSCFRYLARDYGLDKEKEMDAFFYLQYEAGKTNVYPKERGLLRIDRTFYKKNNFARTKSKRDVASFSADSKNWVLVLSKHRFYDQMQFLLYEVSFSQHGKLRSPITAVDLTRQILAESDVAYLKFLTAMLSLQSRFEGGSNEIETLALKVIASNPLDLPVYYHDRSRSDTISAKSLFPVKLTAARPELHLSILQRESYYEIKSVLTILGVDLPMSQLVLKNACFIFFKDQYIYVSDQDLLRVLRFLKEHGDTLLIHTSKYETFTAQFLDPIEEYVQIAYNYIYKVAEELTTQPDYELQKIIYLQKEGLFVSITPVVRYGDTEVAVYSRKQLYGTDEIGRRFKINRDTAFEEQFTASVLLQHPDFEEQLQDPTYFYLYKDKFFDESWFLSAFGYWQQEGITILGFSELGGPRINPYQGKVDIKVNSGKNWFNVHLKIDFGGQVVQLRHLQRAFKNKSKFVELGDGTRGLLPDEWIARISPYFSLGHIEKELLHIPKVRFSEVAALFEQEVLALETREELRSFQDNFLNANEIPVTPIPIGLKATLRGYQHRGFDWLCFLDRFGFGGCLADDMGLGKTVQVITFLLYLKDKYGPQPHLVVVPTSLLFNWQDEIARFAPELRVGCYSGGSRQRMVQHFDTYDVVLVSYGVLSSDIHLFKKKAFHYVILDEAQLIKNPNSERYKTVCLLRSTNRIVLTGTPVENSTFDIFGLFSFACPGLLGNKQFFKDTYAIPIDQFDFQRRTVELEQRIKPFMLRRTKKQVAQELPDKTESIIYCEMGNAQRTVYTSYEEEIRSYLTKTNQDLLEKDRLHILAFLTRLRQICNSPALLQEGHPKAHSVKIDILVEQIHNKMREHKILVFSQFVGMLELIKNRLDKEQISYTYLTGQTLDRKSIVDDFQQNNSVRVFLISLKAGGVGLNLTGADYVYLVDPWWNPAVERQAIDRSYRIGQEKKVTAIRLICTNTIEEKIVDLQQRKQQLAGDLITADNNWFDTLSKQDLLDLVSRTS